MELRHKGFCPMLLLSVPVPTSFTFIATDTERKRANSPSRLPLHTVAFPRHFLLLNFSYFLGQTDPCLQPFISLGTTEN